MLHPTRLSLCRRAVHVPPVRCDQPRGRYGRRPLHRNISQPKTQQRTFLLCSLQPEGSRLCMLSMCPSIHRVTEMSPYSTVGVDGYGERRCIRCHLRLPRFSLPAFFHMASFSFPPPSCAGNLHSASRFPSPPSPSQATPGLLRFRFLAARRLAEVNHPTCRDRGWVRPPCRHFKIQSCCCLGSAFEAAAFQTLANTKPNPWQAQPRGAWCGGHEPPPHRPSRASLCLVRSSPSRHGYLLLHGHRLPPLPLLAAPAPSPAPHPANSADVGQQRCAEVKVWSALCPSCPPRGGEPLLEWYVWVCGCTFAYPLDPPPWCLCRPSPNSSPRSQQSS
jgi:hypothetical protein